MKKLVFALSAVLLILGSCAKDINVSVSNKKTDLSRFSFSATAEKMATKGSYDNSGIYTWKSTDEIGMVLNSDESSYNAWVAKFSYNTSNQKFELNEQYQGSTLTLGDDVYYGKLAFFPYGTNIGTGGETNYDITNDILYVHLFKERDYSVDFTPIPLAVNLGDDRNPSSVTLKHIAAGVRFQLTGIPSGVTKACLTVKDQDITGWYSIARGGIGTSAIAATSESYDRGKTMTFNFASAPSATSDAPLILTYAVPELTTPVVTLSLYNGDQVLYTRTSKPQPSLKKGQILSMPSMVAENNATIISVGVISYVINDLGDSGYKIHYWGGATGEGDVALVAKGNKENKAVGSGYWDNTSQTFEMFSAPIPNDITGFKVYHSSSNRWFGGDASSGNTKAYIFNYSGDKALYE